MKALGKNLIKKLQDSCIMKTLSRMKKVAYK